VKKLKKTNIKDKLSHW